VKRVAATVPSFSCTMVSEDFVRSRSRSWQIHLERISSFLLCGEGVWWQKVGSTYRFFDGDGDADFSEQGPHDCFIFAQLRWVTYRQPEKLAGRN